MLTAVIGVGVTVVLAALVAAFSYGRLAQKVDGINGMVDGKLSRHVIEYRHEPNTGVRVADR
jgi:hypothetical protein